MRARTALAVAERVLCAPGTPGGLTLAAGNAIADLVDRWRGPVCVDVADEDLAPAALALLTRVRQARETGQAADPGRWDSGKKPCRVCGTPTQRRDRSGSPCHLSCDSSAQLDKVAAARVVRGGDEDKDPPIIWGDPRRGGANGGGR